MRQPDRHSFRRDFGRDHQRAMDRMAHRRRIAGWIFVIGFVAAGISMAWLLLNPEMIGAFARRIVVGFGKVRP